jgi:hypothetical protein
MLLLLPVQFDKMDECTVQMEVPTDLEAEALWRLWLACVILVFLKRGGYRHGLISSHFSSFASYRRLDAGSLLSRSESGWWHSVIL